MSFNITKEEFGPLLDQLKSLIKNDLESLESKLESADAPYTPRCAIKMME